MQLLPWKQGFRFHPPDEPDLILWYWFYEWNLFGAVKPDRYSPGNSGRLDFSGAAGGELPLATGITLRALPVSDGVELRLTAQNRTARLWPELASVIPCLSPLHRGQNTPQFLTKRTWFVGEGGLRLVRDGSWRAMHFNRQFRSAIDATSRTGRFPWSHRWPTSRHDADAGILIRESIDAEWVMGVAWERFLAVQANNSSRCLHLAVRLGPIAPGETKVIRGKLYLMRGTRQELVKRMGEDFGFAAVAAGSATSLP